MNAHAPLPLYALWQSLRDTAGSPPRDGAFGSGFWMLASAKGHATPVATYVSDEDPEEKIVTIGTGDTGRDVTSVFDPGEFLAFMSDRWHRLQAVTEEAYRAACDTGEWPDMTPVEHKSNNPPEGFEAIVAEIEELLRDAAKLIEGGPAKTKEEADRAANLKAKLGDLGKQAYEEKRKEKAPHEKAAKDVEERWSPWISKAKLRADDITRAVSEPYLIEQKRLAKIEADRIAAETGAAVAVKVNAGAKGQRTKLVTVWSAKIVDYDAALAALRNHSSVVACIQAIADDTARSRAKTPIPGVEFISRDAAR